MAKAAAIKYKHADHVSWRRVEKEAVILNLNTSAYFSLNEAGAFIWEALAGGASATEIADALCGEYSVDPEKARRDAETLVAQLVKEKLLVRG